MFISIIFGDLGDLPVMVRRPKGALKIFLEHSLGEFNKVINYYQLNRSRKSATLRALPLRQSEWLTLETSALKLFAVANLRDQLSC